MANSNSYSKYSGETGKSAMEAVADNTKEEYAEGYFFPSDDIDPKLKNGVWSRKWSEAIWSLFLRGNLMNSIDLINEMRWLRMYGAGSQPKQLYMDLLDVDNREGYLATNWDIFSPMSKYKRIIQGKFEALEFDYSASAIDPTSLQEKEEAQWEVWYKSQFGQREREIQAMIGLPPEKQVEYIAESLEELDMFREMGGFKIKAEAEAEVVLEATDYLSDIKTIKRKVLNDLVDLNRAAFRDFYDPISKTCKYEYVDWENLIIDYSNETDFLDIRFWGYLKFETINNVRAETGLSENELLSMVKPWLGYFGNYGTQQFAKYQMNNYKTENGDIVYNMFRVPILISEWISTDTEYTTMKNGKRYEQEYGKIYNTDKKKTKVFTKNKVYSATWIVGSKYVYNDGPQLAGSGDKPRLSIHAIRLPGKSIVQTIIPNLDQIQLTKIRLESAIATAKPNGLEIEVGSLSNIDLGDGELAPLELIRIARQTGDILYKATTHAGDRGTPNRPISHSEGGVGNLFNECVKNFEINFNFISELTGIDRVSAASPRGGENTATETRAAVSATSDALQPIFTSYIQLKEWAARSVLPKIQRAIKRFPEVKKTYENIMGTAGVKILEIGDDVGYRQMGIKIEIKPTQEMKQNILQGAMEALKAGRDGATINISDWLFIVSLVEKGRLKQAQAIISYRVNEAHDKAMKMQEENMKLNAQNAQQTEMMKAQNQLALIKAQEESDIRIEAAKALFKMETVKDTALLELQKELIMSTLMLQQQGQPQGQSQGEQVGIPPMQ
jgi:hypothetical protein